MKKTILLIEDDLPTIDIYETILKKAGFKVETLRWGEEALEKLSKIREGKAEKPDLVLLDLILPDTNGIRILEEIRKHDETRDLPVYILTNYTDGKIEKMSHALKAEGYLLKTDYTPDQLLKIIGKKLKK